MDQGEGSGEPHGICRGGSQGALYAGDGSSLADQIPEGVRAAAWWMARHSEAITAISCMQGFIREATFHENKLVVQSVYRRETRSKSKSAAGTRNDRIENQMRHSARNRSANASPAAAAT